MPVLAAVLLGSVALSAVGAASALAAAAWPRRAPAAAILLWQALGLTWGLATVGGLAALAVFPKRGDVAGQLAALAARAVARPAAWTGQYAMLASVRLVFLGLALALLTLLLWVLAAAGMAVVRIRRRHRALLALLARGDPKAPGALVLDHPAAAAYCVPGLRSRIVISAGALALLDQAELAAVLAHERAHGHQRHDLVLLPFTALCRAFPCSPAAGRAYHAVAQLVEMLADDRARRTRPARKLASALMRFGAAGAAAAPSGALAAADGGQGEVMARVTRLLEPPRGLSRPVWTAVCCGALAIVALPAVLVTLPL